MWAEREWLKSQDTPSSSSEEESPASQMKSQTESRLSGLLTAEENAAVLNMIGARAQPLATTVAQVPIV